jgi:uncharacterized membrane protein
MTDEVAVQHPDIDGLPIVHNVNRRDISLALRKGIADFNARPSHLLFLSIIYPVMALIMARLSFGYEVLPLLFPLIAGGAIIGPLAATGMYEISRRRARGRDVSWTHAFKVFRSPAFPSIALFGLVLIVIFLAWMGVARAIYVAIFGDMIPETIGGFVDQIFLTKAGWTLILVGSGAGFIFAVVAFSVSIVSIPLMLDQNVGVVTAIRTSIRAVAINPQSLSVWGLIVAVSLFLGSIPFFIGLAVVMPILGHATWHLYCQIVERTPQHA